MRLPRPEILATIDDMLMNPSKWTVFVEGNSPIQLSEQGAVDLLDTVVSAAVPMAELRLHREGVHTVRIRLVRQWLPTAHKIGERSVVIPYFYATLALDTNTDNNTTQVNLSVVEVDHLVFTLLYSFQDEGQATAYTTLMERLALMYGSAT